MCTKPIVIIIYLFYIAVLEYRIVADALFLSRWHTF